jgi:hypothetical protein
MPISNMNAPLTPNGTGGATPARRTPLQIRL